MRRAVMTVMLVAAGTTTGAAQESPCTVAGPFPEGTVQEFVDWLEQQWPADLRMTDQEKRILLENAEGHPAVTVKAMEDAARGKCVAFAGTTARVPDRDGRLIFFHKGRGYVSTPIRTFTVEIARERGKEWLLWQITTNCYTEETPPLVVVIGRFGYLDAYRWGGPMNVKEFNRRFAVIEDAQLVLMESNGGIYNVRHTIENNPQLFEAETLNQCAEYP